MGRSKQMEKLTVGNTVIEYAIRKSTRAKKINITVSTRGVTVSVPGHVSVQEAKKFVATKKEWILRHIEEYRQKELQNPPKKYIDGEKLLFLGQEITLRTITFNSKKITMEISDGNAWFYIPAIVPEEERPAIIKNALINWYRDFAKKLLFEKAEFYARKMGVKYNQIRIKEQKTRWGSCSRKKNINFNWKIILAPSQAVDYLVVHELAHLKYMNHSACFWQEVEKFFPNYVFWRKWLKQNGNHLTI